MRGQTSHFAGLAAEGNVERWYHDKGFVTLARRWRGQGGEIDLVIRSDTTVVFVEVKKARSHAAAAHRLSLRQLARIEAAAMEFMGTVDGAASFDIRVDLATVDQIGSVAVIENVTMT